MNIYFLGHIFAKKKFQKKIVRKFITVRIRKFSKVGSGQKSSGSATLLNTTTTTTKIEKVIHLYWHNTLALMMHGFALWPTRCIYVALMMHGVDLFLFTLGCTR
jgi:hypothetical protein